MEQEDLQYEELKGENGNNDSTLDGDPGTEDGMNETDQSLETELEAIKARVAEMEDEAEKLRQIQTEVDKQMNMGSPPAQNNTSSTLNLSMEEKMEMDCKSIFVGNVDYGATAEELEQHFHGCGAVHRVTILCNKFDGHPKGFAYVEFAEKDSVQLSMAMDESLFRGRQLKVLPKRTNKPGITTTNRIPRGAERPRRFGGGRRPPSYGGYGGGYGGGGYRPFRRPSRGRRFMYAPY